MKIILIYISILLTSVFNKSSVRIDDFCQVYGIIYFEKNKNYADALVYLEEDETRADLLIFKEDNRLFADEEGIWYITDNPTLANYKLYVVKEKGYADFSVNYIDDRAFVGCQ